MTASTGVHAGRRGVLRGIAALFAQAGLFSVPVRAFAALDPASARIDTDGFLALSQTLTGHRPLSRLTAQRMLILLNDSDPTFAQHAASLAVLARGAATPDTLLAAADGIGLRTAALTIVASWYTGTVGLGPTGKLVAYEQALMYQPVRDGLTVPTYCSNGPLWWTAAIPPIGVAPPKAIAEPRPSAPAVDRNQ